MTGEPEDAPRGLDDAPDPPARPSALRLVGEGDGGERCGVIRTEKGRIVPCLQSAVALLSTWGPSVRHDTFSGRIFLGSREANDADFLAATRWLQSTHEPSFQLATATNALVSLAHDHAVDLLEEHVRALKWDGVPRVDTFASRYLGADDASPYAQEVGRVLLLGAAARALRPGCKLDTMPILEGYQGSGKSTAAAIIGGPFFGELTAALGTKDAAEQLAGAWILEIGELKGLTKAEVTAIKAFVSSREDRFRRAYARAVTSEPRRCAFIGTTNADAYLRDETGARRFLPLRTGRIDLDALARDRNALIAEAVERVDAGEAWTVAHAQRDAAAREAEERFERDPWQDELGPRLEGRPEITVQEALEMLGVETARRTHADVKRVATVLGALGFTRRRSPSPGRPWVYRR